MITEIAMLNVIPGKEREFENDFRIARKYNKLYPFVTP